jgi:hypothetical protein
VRKEGTRQRNLSIIPITLETLQLVWWLAGEELWIEKTVAIVPNALKRLEDWEVFVSWTSTLQEEQTAIGMYRQREERRRGVYSWVRK